MSGPFGSGSFGTGEFSTSPIFPNVEDMITQVLRDTGHSNPTTEVNKRAAVLGFINNCYSYVTTLRHWDWLFQTLDANLEGPYDTGTISIESGSNAVTGVGTAFSSNVLPYNALVPSSRNERYIISEVTSATILALEGEYAGDDITDGAFEIIKPIYTAPADCEHIRSIVIQGVGKLTPIGPQEMARKRQYAPALTGRPQWFTEVGRRAQDGVRMFEVYPAPDQDYSAQLDYGVNIMKLDDSDESYPLIPDRHRAVLYYGALKELCRYMGRMAQMESAEKDYQRLLINMQNDTQLTDSRVILQPSRNYRNRRRTRNVAMDRHDFGREE